ncbi:hypothetical protein BES08_08760 [Novosphingobium resinovorum]|uniref:Uncharacterized protein n=1 Tax=Novosphingobium resinovorum TaxID=158500 RepID=A0A1D8A3Y9_9SPHN|nr:hypothetical protein BES08_08760 [Novosphingobium resinovorum]
MLDHVGAGVVLEQPAGEHLVPRQLFLGRAALFDEDLDEGALFLRLFPGQRLLAGGDLHDEIAEAARFARLHHQVLRQVVALVEDAQRDHAVLVGRADLLAFRGLCRPGLHSGDGIRDAGVLRLGRRLTTAGRQDRQQRECCQSPPANHA